MFAIVLLDSVEPTAEVQTCAHQTHVKTERRVYKRAKKTTNVYVLMASRALTAIYQITAIVTSARMVECATRHPIRTVASVQVVSEVLTVDS
jgi:hypothetical protein